MGFTMKHNVAETTGEGTTAAEINGAEPTGEGTTAAEINGAEITGEGTTVAEINGAEITGEGTTAAEINVTGTNGSETTAAETTEEATGALTGQTAIEVTILMPCLNEAHALAFCIEEAQDCIRRLGLRAARGRYIIMGDADGSYDFSHLDSFVEKLREGNALVMGNRCRCKSVY